MQLGARGLGDNGVVQDDNTFLPDWDDTFLQEIHAVALVTGDSHETANDKLADVKNIFSTSVSEIKTLVGDVRPDAEKGNEQ